MDVFRFFFFFKEIEVKNDSSPVKKKKIDKKDLLRVFVLENLGKINNTNVILNCTRRYLYRYMVHEKCSAQ